MQFLNSSIQYIFSPSFAKDLNAACMPHRIALPTVLFGKIYLFFKFFLFGKLGVSSE